MRIAVVGSGGVGGFFGGRLAASGSEVTFIARGPQLEALQTSGLQIESPQGNLKIPSVKATDNPSQVGPVDIVFFTVKLYDAEAARRFIPPLIGPETIVISFQNGVEATDELARALGRSHVAGGTAYVSAVLSEPGKIRHSALGRLIFGPLEPSQKPRLQQLLDACQKSGFQASLSERIMVDIWAKFVRLTVLSGMTSVVRSSIGPIMADPDLRAILEAALHESIAVARARQVPLPSTLFDEITASFSAIPHSRSSMLDDLERGRPLELPWLSGAVVRIGEEVGAKTPTHRLITAILRPHAQGRQKQMHANGRPPS